MITGQSVNEAIIKALKRTTAGRGQPKEKGSLSKDKEERLFLAANSFEACEECAKINGIKIREKRQQIYVRSETDLGIIMTVFGMHALHRGQLWCGE